MNVEQNLRETIVHRSGSLPVAVYRTDSIYYHWHDEWEFLYNTGAAARCVVNGQHISLAPGEALILHGGDLHMLDVMPGFFVTAIVVHPDLWHAQEHAELFGGGLRFQQRLYPQEPADKEILDLLVQILRCYDQRSFGWQYGIRVLVSSVFARMLDNRMYSIVHEQPHVRRDAFPGMAGYIHRHYAQELSLETLVQEFHYSKSYIIRLFRQNMGVTPVQYIKRYRLDMAKELLQDGDQSIQRIAVACGFANAGYFIRSFKAYTGLSPGEYRKRVNGQKQAVTEEEQAFQADSWTGDTKQLAK